jgi:hypothetical protein
MQQSNISAIFAKVELFNFGQIINHFLLPFAAFLPPFRSDNSAIWRSSQNVQLLYLSGLKNVVADLLSRPNQTTARSVTATSSADPVDFEEMTAEQNHCLETQRLLGGTSLKLAFCQTGAQCLAGDVSTGNFHPIVPLKFRKIIFDHSHNVAHSGRLASSRIISSRFVWRGLSSDITTWARGCLACQRGKIHCHTRLVPHPIPIPQR